MFVVFSYTMFNKENDPNKLLNFALILSLITIIYNVLEGVVATYFGRSDETLALFGFGVDSFVEVISALGITHMIFRMKGNAVAKRDRFERLALRITGSAFYLLSIGLVASAIFAIHTKSEPLTTRAGIVIALISIFTMYFLYKKKLQVGRKLDSAPVISDAHCTKACFYLSFILLASSILYELFQVPYVDAIGGLGIAWYAFKEGREAFDKAASASLGKC
ncbi:MAG: cation transporter [Saprospiraceae bacterium]|nr:cation transporter [Saprospiraceae bacterium]